jgi:hypothetical protein
MDDKSSGLYTLGLPAEEEKKQKQQIEKKEFFWGALCTSMSPSFTVRNIIVLHNTHQPRVVKVQSTLALPQALQINRSINQQKNFERSDIGVSPSGAK